MSSDEREDNTIYKVVVNHEEQYSIWPADRETRSAGTMKGRRARKLNASLTSRRSGPTCGRSVYARRWKSKRVGPANN